MVYGRLYVYYARTGDKQVYNRGGFYRSMIITRLKAPDFKIFVSCVSQDKPLYALVCKTSQLVRGPLAFMEDELVNGDRVLVIPTGLNTKDLPLVPAEGTQNMDTNLRAGVLIEKALLFSSLDPEGYIDEDLISNPLDLLKRSALAISRNDVASPGDIASTIWKLRNQISLVSIATHIRATTKAKAAGGTDGK